MIKEDASTRKLKADFNDPTLLP